jgi:hypothetical protein
LPPKVPEDVKRDLAERGLALWHCQHPMVPSPGGHTKQDKTRVHVQLAGPKVKISPWGYGANVREAVANALDNIWLRAEMPGLAGSMARLEIAMTTLYLTNTDDVPF